jgi:hypothetical protein
MRNLPFIKFKIPSLGFSVNENVSLSKHDSRGKTHKLKDRGRELF